MLPGDPLTATGGYEYDRRMVAALRNSGWKVRIRPLDSSFPSPDERALSDARQQLAACPDQGLVLIDGLALGVMPDVVQPHAQRLQMVGLIHHPLAAETGLSATQAAQLHESERRALQAMRLIIVTSEATRDALADYGVDASRIAVIEPGVDQPAQAGSVSGKVDSHAPVRLLCVATITPRKGHDLLIDALTELREYAWTLICTGDLTRSESTTHALRRQIAAAGLGERVTLTGEVDETELQRQFSNADAFVLSTRYEGYGMVVAQALTHGLPVISTRTGAIESLVSSQAGLLVTPGDVDELRIALASILTDAGLRRRLGTGARQIGARLPSWESASQHMATALADAAQRPLASRARP